MCLMAMSFFCRDSESEKLFYNTFQIALNRCCKGDNTGSRTLIVQIQYAKRGYETNGTRVIEKAKRTMVAIDN